MKNNNYHVRCYRPYLTNFIVIVSAITVTTRLKLLRCMIVAESKSTRDV